MIRLMCLMLLIMSTAAYAKKPSGNTQTLRLLSTNMENFFDWTHDKGKADYTFLPLAVKQAMPEAMAWCNAQSGFYKEECLTLDYTEEVAMRKVNRIIDVIKGTMYPNLPDVIVVQEVENINALSMVARGLGPQYKAILLEGPDERGIDTGMITRLPVKRVKLTEFATTTGRPTRGILEVDVMLGKKRITVFGNHWPSQSNPDADRMVAGHTMLGLALKAQKRSHTVIAAGDFNTADDDELNALEQLIFPNFLDVESEALAQGVDLGAAASYSYRGVWASLDHIFILKNNRNANLDYSGASFFTEGGNLVEHYEYRGVAESRPLRYSHTDGSGYSDHLPFSIALKL